jgi:hypothetical protein
METNKKYHEILDHLEHTLEEIVHTVIPKPLKTLKKKK